MLYCYILMCIDSVLLYFLLSCHTCTHRHTHTKKQKIQLLGLSKISVLTVGWPSKINMVDSSQDPPMFTHHHLHAALFRSFGSGRHDLHLSPQEKPMNRWRPHRQKRPAACTWSMTTIPSLHQTTSTPPASNIVNTVMHVNCTCISWLHNGILY